MSSRDIERHLQDVYGCDVYHVTVYRWTKKYLQILAKVEKKLVACRSVNWKGERKEASFYNLPEPWKGVNVFIKDWDTQFAIVAKVPDIEFAFIERSKFSKDL